MPTPLSSILGSGRRATFVLTESDAAFAIPAWAQNGKSHMRVWGTAAGGSSSSESNFDAGRAGGSGAWCREFVIPLPAGVTELNCVVGVGGAAVAPNTSGQAGGSTSITVGGVRALGLQGGGGGTIGGSPGFAGSFLIPSGAATAAGHTNTNIFSGTLNTGHMGGENGAPSTSRMSGTAYNSTSSGAGNGYGIGGGYNAASPPTPGFGYGWGGAGRIANASPLGGMAGGNGWLQIEFVEGV